MSWILGVLLFFTALFLIMLVLVQRGRGGGLTGALGGMGGQSAFGAKAGDLFTRITMVTATVWIVLCLASYSILGKKGQSRLEGAGSNAPVTENSGVTDPSDEDE